MLSGRQISSGCQAFCKMLPLTVSYRAPAMMVHILCVGNPVQYTENQKEYNNPTSDDSGNSSRMEALKGRWASAAAACILADKMQAVSVCIPEYTDGKYRFPVPACTAEQGCMGSGPARTVFAGCRSRLCSLICYSCT